MTKSKFLFISLTSIITGLLIAVAVMAWTNPTGNPTTGGGAIGVGADAPASSLYIDSSGNVGIGTANPGSYKLNVAGTANATAYSVGGTAGWTGSYNNISVDSRTKLLLHLDGTNGQTTYTSDDTNTRIATFVGTAQLSTAQKEFGTASLLLDGDSDYLSVPNSTDWDFGAGDFTIDAWINPDATLFDSMTYPTIASTYTAYLNNWYFRMTDSLASGSIGLFMQGGDPGTAQGGCDSVALAWTAGTWYHVAIVMYSGTMKVYRNGTDVTGSNSITSINATNSALYVGVLPYTGTIGYQYWDGYIDEFRISKGIARWTANFTPPAGPYGTINVTNGIITGAQ